MQSGNSHEFHARFPATKVTAGNQRKAAHPSAAFPLSTSCPIFINSSRQGQKTKSKNWYETLWKWEGHGATTSRAGQTAAGIVYDRTVHRMPMAVPKMNRRLDVGAVCTKEVAMAEGPRLSLGHKLPRLYDDGELFYCQFLRPHQNIPVSTSPHLLKNE